MVVIDQLFSLWLDLEAYLFQVECDGIVKLLTKLAGDGSKMGVLLWFLNACGGACYVRITCCSVDWMMDAPMRLWIECCMLFLIERQMLRWIECLLATGSPSMSECISSGALSV